MTCQSLGECGSCTEFDKTYEQQLETKLDTLSKLLKVDKNSIKIFTSPLEGYRKRGEFRVYHDDNSVYFCMNGLAKKKVTINECKIVSPPIQRAIKELPPLLKDVLKERLYGVEFLSNDKEELITTLIYHKKLDETWMADAEKLSKQINSNIIGRSKGQKIVIGKEAILEDVGGHSVYIREGAFCQPNRVVNKSMVSWVGSGEIDDKDRLELYCGSGNFTFSLAKKCRKLLATEISKVAISDAKEACIINSVDNIEFVRLSSEELIEALSGKREFFRLKDINLKSYEFESVFVDPPRAGLTPSVTEFVKTFEKIIYISCNPLTLARDLEELKMFDIEEIAMFDQFPHTKHIECGVKLTKKD